MGDVADILGLSSKQGGASSSSIENFVGGVAGNKSGKKTGPAAKPKGMSREVFSLLGKDALVPAIQPSNPSAMFRSKRSNSLKGKWVWSIMKPFQARSLIDQEHLYHWVRADVDFADYPYSKFNTKLEAVTYTDDEYESLLRSQTWSRSETDHMMFLCLKFDLRWPVIVDRYNLVPGRTADEIQERYYQVVTTLKKSRSNATEVQIKNECNTIFDGEYHRARRSQQEFNLRRSKEDDAEEAILREELKNIDITLKKMKKSSKEKAILRPIFGDGKSTGISIPPPAVEQPQPGKPRLQSTRLVPLEYTSGISRSLAKKMQLLLNELGAPENPIPTRSVCDLLESVRKNACVLLGLQSALAKKEKELAGMKAQAKVQMVTQDEEPITVPTLLTDYKRPIIVAHSMMTNSEYTASNSTLNSSSTAARKPPIPKRKPSDFLSDNSPVVETASSAKDTNKSSQGGPSALKKMKK